MSVMCNVILAFNFYTISHLPVPFQTETDCNYLLISNSRELLHQIISEVKLLSDRHQTFRRRYPYPCSSDVAKGSDCMIEHR